MNSPLHTISARMISTLLCTTTLVACGGGGGTSTSADSVQASLVISKGGTALPVSPTTPVTPPVTTTPTAPVTPVAPTGALVVITDVRVENTSTAAQTSVPVTFGQVFAAGDVKTTDVLIGRLDDNTLVTLQADVKARHPDGSIRHAIISAVIPSIGTGATRTLTLVKGGTAAASVATVAPSELINNGFTASVSATINGVKYTASASDLLKAGVKATWLAGSVANEWQVSAPLKTAAGVAHPHLAARFALRWYGAVKKARVDVTVENDWAYQPNPQNFTYDAEVIVGGKSVYQKAALPHYHHARWRKVFWYGGDASQVNIRENTKYLIASRAVPNYDQSFSVSDGTLSDLASWYTSLNASEPMSVGAASPYMPTTGGRSDIGIMPGWATTYLLTMEKRARDVTLGTADLAGSWSIHYRDADTDQPISLVDHNAMTIAGRDTDTLNTVTGKWDKFPACASDGLCTTPNVADNAHQPGFAYLPYLLTGDYYYLEELQFFTMYNLFWDNPNYRLWEKGLLSPGQVRAQAWSLRTLAEAAYITPDADRLKSHFTTFLDNNLNWYITTYVGNAATSNNFGVLVNGYAFSYNYDSGIAPWQDDFFTSAVGHAAELGYTKATTLLAWKTKFVMMRMMDPATCWIDAGLYSFNLKASSTSPLFTTYAEAWKASHTAAFNGLACNSQAMATNLGVKVNEMTGFSDATVGYPSNLQPALAYAVDVGAPNSKAAWTLFMSRLIKPDYSTGPQFDIIPR